MRALQTYARSVLELLGMRRVAHINAKAFSRLQSELFRMPWVKGVEARGFARPSVGHTPRTDGCVYVIASQTPRIEMRQDVERIMSGVNRRYGTNLRASVVER
jgi:hypothetical protein